jgi:hypothetical protein
VGQRPLRSGIFGIEAYQLSNFVYVFPRSSMLAITGPMTLASSPWVGATNNDCPHSGPG